MASYAWDLVVTARSRHKRGRTLTYIEKQHLMSACVSLLLDKAIGTYDGVAGNEWWRNPAQAKRYAKQGKGIKLSLHMDRLAMDIVLRKKLPSGKWKYLSRSEDYAALGAYWKSLHPLCCWGGDFTRRPDGNHLSISHGGRK